MCHRTIRCRPDADSALDTCPKRQTHGFGNVRGGAGFGKFKMPDPGGFAKRHDVFKQAMNTGIDRTGPGLGGDAGSPGTRPVNQSVCCKLVQGPLCRNSRYTEEVDELLFTRQLLVFFIGAVVNPVAQQRE